MKKTAAVVFALSLFVSAPAFAGWQTDLSTAISSGNADKIAAVLATYPDDQGPIVLSMLSQASTLLATNPTLATSLYKTASSVAPALPSTDANAIVAAVQAFLAKAKDPDFQKNYPSQTAAIFSTSLTLASIPSVVAIAPNLYEEALVAANEFLDKKPIDSADINSLEDTVLLAQNAGFTPPGPTGANQKVADPLFTPAVAPPSGSAE